MAAVPGVKHSGASVTFDSTYRPEAGQEHTRPKSSEQRSSSAVQKQYKQ